MSTLLSKVVLLEGITHIEDLPVKEFIRTVESLRDKIVTEKLDGANLWFGLDDTGFFTSREGKSPKKGRFYSVDDYAMVANYNAFRAAHLALERVEPTIRKYLKPGDMVEIEVLFGRQPNTVTYGVEGKSFIVILRGVNGTPQDRVDALSQGLNHKKVTVESTIVSSPDGTEIEMNDEKMTWEFTNVEPMQGKAIDTKEAMGLLAKMKHFIAEKNEDFPELTNQEVAELSLTSVDKSRKDEAKQERERVNAYIMNEFKAPIKELLLNNFVRKIKPMLSDKKLHPSEDIGVEGVVVRDPVTGSMTKIVDKDVFTAINTFNSAVRANVSGLVRTTDQDAAVEMRGGAFGQAKIRIAELIGAKELALSSGTKRWMAKFKKSDAGQTALAAANSLNIKSVPSVRTKIAAILNETLKEVDSILHSFKEEAGEFKLKLKTGKEIGITPEVMKRTLTAFAETKKDIAEVAANVMKSKTAADIVMALYGKQIESLFDGGDAVKESYSMLKSLTEDGDGGAVAPGGASPGAGGTSAASVGTTSSNVATTKAGNIAPYPFKLAGGKMIMRRKRGFVKPKKFPAPGAMGSFEPKDAKMGVPEGKFSLIKSMNENWAHVSDMKFATDVDDRANRSGDVEFNQLRNNVNVGDENDLTAMDVDRYLDKAHEINDEVDSVIFGMELDDGNVVKVYVNAGQADEFENALGQMLGKEDDVEKVINDLANKFDIVDVEWPATMQAPQPGEETLPAPEGEAPPTDDMSNPDMNLDIEPHHEEGGGEEGGVNLELEPHHDEGGGEAGDEESTPPPEEEEGEGGAAEEGGEEEEGEGGEERNEFGEVVGKKKKKKKKTETEEEPTEESAVPKGPVLSEAAPATDAVMNLLTLLGFDLNVNRSIASQAARQQVKSPLQKFNAQPSTVNKLTQVVTTLTDRLKGVTPGTSASTNPPSNAAPAVTAGYSLLGSIISEEGEDAVEGKWIIGKMGQTGLLLKAKGLTIRINDEEATKLAVGLHDKRVVSVSSGDKRFVFTPFEDGSFLVKEKDSEEFKDGLVMGPEQVQDVLDIIEAE